MHQTTKQIRTRWTAKAVHPARTSSPCTDIERMVTGANQVHQALCAPPVQNLANFQFASAIVPARYVSGDFVLSFEQRGSQFLVLGDLMGKGLAAAMWLTHVVDLIRRACDREDALGSIMGRLNYEMHRSRVGLPLTSLFLAQLNAGESRITYSCGGCPAAFLLCDQSVRMLERGGPVLGALAHAEFGTGSVELKMNQVLLAVSDGITEVHHGAHFELRPDRVASHLQFTAGDSADSIVRSLTAKVRSQSPVLADDVSVMAIQRIA